MQDRGPNERLPNERQQMARLVELAQDQIQVEMHTYEALLFLAGILLSLCWHRGAIAREPW